MASINSIPETLDWTWYVGDTEPEEFIITSEAGVDLTGATITAQARLTKKDPVLAAEAVITETDLANGTFHVGWPASVRDLVDAEATDKWVGVWDLQIVMPSGLVRTRAGGRMTFTYDVTRETP